MILDPKTTGFSLFVKAATTFRCVWCRWDFLSLFGSSKKLNRIYAGPGIQCRNTRPIEYFMRATETARRLRGAAEMAEETADGLPEAKQNERTQILPPDSHAGSRWPEVISTALLRPYDVSIQLEAGWSGLS